MLADEKVRNVADQATDAPYSEEYCCEVIVSGKFLAANAKATAAATRALLKGAKWVEANPAAAAQLSVEKKYLASNPQINTVAISHLQYIPSVSRAEASVLTADEGMKTAGSFYQALMSQIWPNAPSYISRAFPTNGSET